MNNNLEQKQKVVGELTEKFRKSNGSYFLNFTSMTVAATNKLRHLFHEKGVEYKVAKNTMIWRAIQEVGYQGIDESQLKGNTGIVFGYDDPLVPAKILKPILEKEETPKFKGAIVEGVFYDASQFKTLANLPSKSELIAGILGSLNAPVSGIVGSLNAVMRDLASVIEEVAKKQNN